MVTSAETCYPAADRKLAGTANMSGELVPGKVIRLEVNEDRISPSSNDKTSPSGLVFVYKLEEKAMFKMFCLKNERTIKFLFFCLSGRNNSL